MASLFISDREIQSLRDTAPTHAQASPQRASGAPRPRAYLPTSSGPPLLAYVLKGFYAAMLCTVCLFSEHVSAVVTATIGHSQPKRSHRFVSTSWLEMGCLMERGIGCCKEHGVMRVEWTTVTLTTTTETITSRLYS
ncbi:hypothetical protein EVAR_35335_1 [Eumeta japonica]|uniref:Uncharacterized protein n=1 Tax=Eumeta variegata TaxID=151549 RepID=A0A4C1XMK4_EUMVA|nr:hypothetical protein EVAR_35335_1 [Eumeta japonica]